MKIGIQNPSKHEMAAFLESVVGVVEASSFESLCLWREYSQELRKPWSSGTSGPMVQVGTVVSGGEDMPVCMSLLVNEVDGHRVLFVNVTSRCVDHDMVRNWLEQTLPVTAFRNGDPRLGLNITDAMNFPNVLPRKKRAA